MRFPSTQVLVGLCLGSLLHLCAGCGGSSDPSTDAGLDAFDGGDPDGATDGSDGSDGGGDVVDPPFSLPDDFLSQQLIFLPRAFPSPPITHTWHTVSSSRSGSS